jgi:hypothetical protein
LDGAITEQRQKITALRDARARVGEPGDPFNTELPEVREAEQRRIDLELIEPAQAILAELELLRDALPQGASSGNDSALLLRARAHRHDQIRRCGLAVRHDLRARVRRARSAGHRDAFGCVA